MTNTGQRAFREVRYDVSGGTATMTLHRPDRLVSRVVPAAELMPVARALAEEIAANTSAVSVTLARRMLWSMLGEPTPWDARRLVTGRRRAGASYVTLCA